MDGLVEVLHGGYGSLEDVPRLDGRGVCGQDCISAESLLGEYMAEASHLVAVVWQSEDISEGVCYVGYWRHRDVFEASREILEHSSELCSGSRKQE